MLCCPNCGTRSKSASLATCIACDAPLTPRVASRNSAKAEPVAARLREWLGNNPAFIAKTRALLRGWARLFVLLILSAAVTCGLFRYLKAKRRGRTLEAGEAIALIASNQDFQKLRCIWLPKEARVYPDGRWLSTSHRDKGEDPVPTEVEDTKTGAFRGQYDAAEMELDCPPMMLVKALRLGTVVDRTIASYYTYPEERVTWTYQEPEGGPGRWIEHKTAIDKVYRLWGHTLSVDLSQSGLLDARNWREVPSRRLSDPQWFPYDADDPDVRRVTDVDTNVRRECVGGWMVPIGSRRALAITMLRRIDSTHVDVEFSWGWEPTDLGQAFLRGHDGQLEPLLKQFVSATGVTMGTPGALGHGEARFQYQDEWRLVQYDLQNPR